MNQHRPPTITPMMLLGIFSVMTLGVIIIAALS